MTPSTREPGMSGAIGTDTSAQDPKEAAKQTADGAKEAAKQTAMETKDAALDTAQQIKDDVQAQVGEVAGEAKLQATELMGQAKEQASSAFAKQQEQAVGGLGSLADALRQTAQRLKEGDDGAQAGIGRFVEDAADRLAQSADFLRDKEPNELLRDVQDFAKKQPVAFVGAAVGIGIIAARLMKSGGGSAQLGQAMGSLSEQATQAMDAVKDRVSEMTGSGDDAKPSPRTGSSGAGAPAASSTASSPAPGGFGQMDAAASDIEIGQTPGRAGGGFGGTSDSTGTAGMPSAASSGYAPDVDSGLGREGQS